MPALVPGSAARGRQCEHRQGEHREQARGLRDGVGGAEAVEVQGVVDGVQHGRDRPGGAEWDDELGAMAVTAAQANSIANAR